MFFVGLKPDGALSIFERTFPRSMGMGVGRDGALWMSSLFQMWRFRNFLDPGQVKDGFDAVYVPVTGHTTGDIDIHDIHTDELDGPVFVATRFNCLASLTDEGSFKVRWKPPFIDRIAAEDGVPKYVTCVVKTNVLDGWREHRREGGMVLDIESGEAVATGLSMPHSPRLHNGKLWLIQSGTGEFGHIDMKTGKFEAACFLQGFARGVTFLGDHAIVGVSRPRQERTFEGLELSERLEKEGVSPVCGLAVVNLSTGDIEHRLTIEGVVEELYDVLAIPGVIRPMALGFKSDEIRFAVRPVE